MKKVLSIILVVILVIIVLPMSVLAATPTSSLVASSSSIHAGETVTVTVKMSNCSTTSLGIIPSYDTTNFELVSGEWLVSGAAMSDFSDGCAVIAYTSNYNFSGDVFRFVLKAKTNAKISSHTVKCEVQAEGYSVTNPSCTVSVACNHSWGNWTQTNASTHTRTCSKCQATETKSHTFDNACDTTCNDCGYTRTITHKYQTTWSSDGTSHWHQCSVCGNKTDVTKHTPGAAATEEHAQTCTVCGYVIQKALTHTHTLEKTLTKNANGHGYKCTKCGEIVNLEQHIYDNACDPTCNTCGYERTITHQYSGQYTSDQTGHWHSCTVCGDKKDFSAHTPGPEATEETPQTCTVCGYVIKPPKAHEHSFEGEYHSNADEHWKCCACGEESEHQAHSWDSGSVIKAPTESDHGEKVYKCTECGYEKEVELELLVKEAEGTVPGDSETEKEHDAESDKKKDTEKDSISPIAAGGIGAGAMLLLCLIPIITLAKKKK